jgi:hypothetical protein
LKLSHCCTLLIVVLLSSLQRGYANDWPQWRGPDRDGIAHDEPPLISSWPEDGPPLLWEYADPGGRTGGLGSIVIADGKMFTVICPRIEEPIPTRKLGAEELGGIGWFTDKLPDDLAVKLESARLSDQRAALAPDEVEPWIEQWLKEHLTDKQYGLLNVAVRNCLERGRAGISVKTVAKLSAIKDKLFDSEQQLEAWLLEQDIAADERKAVHDAAIKTFERVRDVLLCLDAVSGEELWQRSHEGEPVNSLYDGSSGTPCVDAGRVYFVSSTGWAFCLSAEDGSEIWRAKMRNFTDASFLVADGIAVIPSDELVGLDADTGAELWVQPEIKTEQNSAVLWRSNGVAYAICNTIRSLKCVELATGKIRWQVPVGISRPRPSSATTWRYSHSTPRQA